MNNELVSIVVSIYNMEKYLDRCLCSIKSQSYKNLEILMIDDGSIDKSAVIAKKYEQEDHRFKYFWKENGGLSSSRNFGIAKSRGAFIAFIDADDFIATNYVSVLCNAFTDSVGVVIADYVIYDENANDFYNHEGDGVKELVYKSLIEKETIIADLLNHGSLYMPVWKNMYKANLIKQNDLKFISERLVYMEDQLFNLEVYYAAKEIKTISNKIYYHQIIAGSLSQGYRKNMFNMTKERYRRICNYLRENNKWRILQIYNDNFLDTIIDTMIMLCKCGLLESSKNIEIVVNDSLVKSVFRGKKIKLKAAYKIIYFITKLDYPIIVAFLIKMMMMTNAFFRVFQHRSRFIIMNT